MSSYNGLLEGKKRFFDLCAIGFLAIHLFFLLLNWHNYPTELDTSYHLLMGKMFSDEGRIALWDSYEFAPLGRPNLYPPLEHILVWFLHGITGLSFMDVGRLIVIAQSLLGLFLVWWVARRFFNAGAGLFALIFFASNTEMWWWQTSVAPIALITILFLPFIYLYYKKKIVGPTIIFASCLYLHYGLSLTLAATVAIATLCDARYRKEYLKNLIIILGISFLLFLPWALHIFNFRDYFLSRSVDVKNLYLFSLEIFFAEILFHLNLLQALFLIAGLSYCYRRRNEDFKYSLLLAGFLSYFAFLFLFQGVRLNAHSPIVTSVLAGAGFSWVFNRTKGLRLWPLASVVKIFLIFLIVASLFFELHYLTPRLLKKNSAHGFFMAIKKHEAFFRPTPLLNEIISGFSNRPLKAKHAIRIQTFFTERDTDALLSYISRHIEPSAILHVNNGALADYITLETGRKTDDGMFYEIVSHEMVEAIAANRRHGYYISTSSLFDEVFVAGEGKKEPPQVIKKVGIYYIGYKPPIPAVRGIN